MKLTEFQKKLAFIALGFLIICVYFSRLFIPEPKLFSTPDFGHSDLWHLNIPLRKIYSESLQKNQLPLWDQRIGNGYPVFAENEVGALNLQNLILYKFFPFVTAFNLSYIFIFLTAFFGCFLLFDEFRINYFLSFTGALIFTFSGFFITKIVHPNLIHTASYFPLLFFLLEKLSKSILSFLSRNSIRDKLQRESILYLILFIFFQIQCFLAGFPQFFLIINFFFFLYLFLMKQWKNMIIYVFSIVSTLIICLPQIIPSLEFARAAGRSRGLPLESLASFPFNPKHLLSFFNPFIFGNPKFGTYPAFNSDWGIFWESTFYVGIVTFVIFLLAIVLHSKFLSSHKTKTIFKIGLLSLFLGLGKYTPFFLIIQLPIFNMFRVPARFNFLFMFSIIFITIIFLNRIYNNISHKKIFNAIIFLLIFPELMFQFWSYHLIVPAHQVFSPPEIVKYLKKNDVVFSYNPYENWNKVFMKKGWGSEEETKKYVFLKNQLDENMNVFWGIKNFKVYASSPLQNQSFVNQSIDNLLSKRLNQKKQKKIILQNADINIFKRYGINILISPFPISEKDVKLVSKLQHGDIKIYMYKLNVKTFVWRVPLKIITKKNINSEDLAKFNINTALIRGKDNKPTVANNSCNKIQVKIENDTFFVNHSCKKNTLLIINQTFYRDNKIIVNGKAKKGIEVNVSQTGIWL